MGIQVGMMPEDAEVDYQHVIRHGATSSHEEPWEWCSRHLEPGTWARSLGCWRFSTRESAVAFYLAWGDDGDN